MKYTPVIDVRRMGGWEMSFARSKHKGRTDVALNTKRTQERSD
jgi:hypothetical protein